MVKGIVEPLIETSRLYVDYVTSDSEDIECQMLYQGVFSDAAVMRYLLQGRSLTYQETLSFIRDNFSQAKNTLGFMGLFEKNTHALIGFCGILECHSLFKQLLDKQVFPLNDDEIKTAAYSAVKNTREDIIAVEFGYALAQQYWGNAYAYEIGKAQIACATTYFPNAMVLACCHPENAPSIHVLQQLPMEYIDSIYDEKRGERWVYCLNTHLSIGHTLFPSTE
ncbi:GNAT family N-acetyltransferase [Eionea flava]